MPKILDLDPRPFEKIKAAPSDKTREIITPSRLTAKSLGVPRKSLFHLAVNHLRSQNREIIDPLTQQRLFRQAIQTILKPTDLPGIAQQWLPTIGLILQNSPNLDNLPTNLSSHIQCCFKVAQAYIKLIREQNLVDSYEIYWQALANPPTPRSLILYGYFSPRWDEIAFINAITDDNSRLYLPALDNAIFGHNHAIKTKLVEQRWQIENHASEVQTLGDRAAQVFIGNSSPTTEGITLQIYGTRDAEMRGILKQIKQKLIQGISAKDIALIAANEVSYGAQLLDIAWEYGIPLRVLYDMPFFSTRLGAWLSQLMAVITHQFPFEITAKVLSHPLCSNPTQGFWAEVRRDRPSGWAQWQNVAKLMLDIDLKSLKITGKRKNRTNWIGQWQQIFTTFNLRKRCARWSREITAFNRLDAALIHLSRLEDKLLSWTEFHEELEELMSLLTVPAQPGRGGVELHNPTRVMGARYSYVCIYFRDGGRDFTGTHR